ncbi:MAG: DNA-binding response regulator [Thermoleophilia bacterium]|nr:DNA-binding response regulator [Thermoleophilia bacterium]
METASTRVLTCVLADDHDAVRSAVRSQLDRLPWVAVGAEARCGEEALEHILQLEPDVAIVDVRMPRGSGFEVCAAVRERGLPTHVILYSALAEPENMKLGLEVGATAFVAKDMGFPALRVELERLLAVVHAD